MIVQASGVLSPKPDTPCTSRAHQGLGLMARATRLGPHPGSSRGPHATCTVAASQPTLRPPGAAHLSWPLPRRPSPGPSRSPAGSSC